MATRKKRTSVSRSVATTMRAGARLKLKKGYRFLKGGRIVKAKAKKK